MHPHQQRAIVPQATLVMLPADVPSPRGTLLPNLETALNATWDAEVRAGERIAVIGGGAVGLLVAFVLSVTHRGEVVLVEAEAARRQFAARLPWVGAALAPEELESGTFAVAFHATGTSRGLQLAIDARRQRFPQETPHVYKPLAGREDENRWNEQARAAVLKNYNQLDMFI